MPPDYDSQDNGPGADNGGDWTTGRAEKAQDPKSPFTVMRLNEWSPRSWAVIDRSGAIATDDRGRLMMRFSQLEAKMLAHRLNGEHGKMN